MRARTRSDYVGWRRDPNTPVLSRWWDGNDWTNTVRPRSLPARASARRAGRCIPLGTLSLSEDARRALVIVLVTICVFTGWGYQSHLAATRLSTEDAPEVTSVDRGDPTVATFVSDMDGNAHVSRSSTAGP
ncbi:DUF2510 domain-containing protein [Rhodococcus rhodochrous]|nr:DUF2510 domain-containing protein [Rhodococcus rhodochrous]